MVVVKFANVMFFAINSKKIVRNIFISFYLSCNVKTIGTKIWLRTDIVFEKCVKFLPFAEFFLTAVYWVKNINFNLPVMKFMYIWPFTLSTQQCKPPNVLYNSKTGVACRYKGYLWWFSKDSKKRFKNTLPTYCHIHQKLT